MDPEIRSAFHDLNSKVDIIGKDIRDHMVEDMKRVTEIRVCMGAHKETLCSHLEDHKEAKKWWMAIWGSVVFTFLLAAWNWIKRTL